MASPELEAFWRLDELGLILTGEYFSPFKAGRQHYTRMLEKYETRLNASNRRFPGLRSGSPPEAKAFDDESSPETD
jgi:hypothetical protein